MIKRSLIPFLSLGLLLVIPLFSILNLETKYEGFNKLPTFVILAITFSTFVSLLILCNKKKLDFKIKPYYIYILVSCYGLLFSILGTLKHYSFYSTGLDLGYYNQAMWGLMNGIMPTSILEYPFLGGHVQPILLLIALLYYVFETPITLVVVQSFMIAIAVIPLYKLGCMKLKNSRAAILISLAYLTFLPLWYASLFDFHPLVLALPFLMYALYFLVNKNYKGFITSMILASACKEYISLLFVPIGVYLFFVHKKKILAITGAIFGVGWFLISLYIIIPIFLPSGYAFLADNSVLGSGLYEITKTILLNPFIVIGEAAGFGAVIYLALLFIPIGFGIAAIFAPEFLFLGLTEFMIVILHDSETIPEIVYHHQTTLVPFILVASVIGLTRIMNFFKNKKMKYFNKDNVLISLSLFIALMSIFSNIAYGPFTTLYNLKDFDVTSEYVKTGHSALKQIPPQASVAAPNWILPHLSQREKIYRLSNYVKNSTYAQNQGDPEFLIFDFSDAINDPKRSANKIDVGTYEKIISGERYSVVYQQNTWTVLKLS